MNESDRRADARHNIRVPMRVRELNKAGSPELFAESENLSQRGIYFETNVPPAIGTPIEVILRMPKELLGGTASHVKCAARVVHVRQSSPGKAGIGVYIERYETTALEPERWAS